MKFLEFLGQARVCAVNANGAVEVITLQRRRGRYVESDDTALALRAHTGDRAAFSEIVRRYQRPIYAHVCHLLGDQEAAEDVTQEVFLRAWKAIGRFDPEKPLAPWLYSIARRRAFSRWRVVRSRAPEVGLDEMVVEPAGEQNVESDLMSAELSQTVRAAILQLPPQQREAFVLVELEGKTAVEASSLMDCSPATVRQHIFRGKSKLRELLASYVQGAASGGSKA